jgi:hypothetical protein
MVWPYVLLVGPGRDGAYWLREIALVLLLRRSQPSILIAGVTVYYHLFRMSLFFSPLPLSPIIPGTWYRAVIVLFMYDE